MVYSTRKQTERFEDALMELGALGLLEIEGQKLLQESSELNAAEETQPTEKTWNTVKRNLWRQKQKNRISKAAKVIRPVFVRAAVFFFAVFLGTGSILVASADAREVLYRLLFSEYERYIEIDPAPVISEAFVDLEEYQAAGAAFGPTYVPDKVVLTKWFSGEYDLMFAYDNPKNSQKKYTLTFSITKMTEGATYRVDSEDADRIEYMTIGESEGLLIVKDDFTGITWYVGDTLLDVISNLPTEEVIKFAQGIRNL